MPPPLSFGLNASKKPKQAPPSNNQKRKRPVFGDDGDSDDDNNNTNTPTETLTFTDDGIEGLQELPAPTRQQPPSKPSQKLPPPKRKAPGITPTSATNITISKPLKKDSIFADPDDDDADMPAAPVPGLHTTAQPNEAAAAADAEPAPKSDPKRDTQATTTANRFENLSAMYTKRKQAEEASTIDPSVYEYDAVYDSLHTKPDKKKSSASAAGADGGVPKYMESLLRSAEVRKRDQLRARDRMLAKEREAEGDEFADKEKFVTAAYKAQQEELRRVEAEEAAREQAEEERKRKSGVTGMTGFYRDMLSRGEEQHEAAVKAAEEAARRKAAGEEVPADEKEEGAEDGAKSEAQKAEELNARGARVAVNDEGQVVDKRQLLSAGLNVAPKPKTQQVGPGAAAARAAAPTQRFDQRSQRTAREAQRARQTEMVAAQLEEQARQEEEAEAARQREIAERSRSRKTEGDVSSARERYLARKREREAAQKK